MANRTPFAPGEWYHCYNRGVDKRKVFESRRDYERFLLLMCASKYKNNIRISNYKNWSFQEIINDESLVSGSQIVELGAYSLMPNHIHFALKETKEGGVATFMQKVFTGYTMYFNLKNERTGSLFSGTFKSRHVFDDKYFKHLISYIHLNPVELIEPGWKEGKGSLKNIKHFLSRYGYSSLPEFSGVRRPENKITDLSVLELFDKVPTTKEMLADAQAYYQECSKVKPCYK